MSLRILVVALLLFTGGSAAHAHKSPVKRTLMFEPAGTTLHVLANIRVPGGKHRVALLALADVDRNGKIEGAERSQLEAHLAERALFGVKLLVGTSSVVLQGAETKLNIPDDPASEIEMLLHGTATLPPTAVQLRLTTSKTGDALEVRALPGNRPVTQLSRGKLEKGGYKTSLGPLDDLRWTVAEESQQGSRSLRKP